MQFDFINLYKIIKKMKLYPIESGNFKLDGGAMFGVVPKTIWNKTNPADKNNLIDFRRFQQVSKMIISSIF